MVSLQMAHEISSQNAGIAPICNTSSLLDYIYCVNSYQNVILLFFYISKDTSKSTKNYSFRLCIDPCSRLVNSAFIGHQLITLKAKSD